MKIDLTGKLAVVTGAPGRLGEWIVPVLAECGADVVVHYHQNADGAKELCERVEKAGRRAFAIQADVTDFDSVLAMRDMIVKKLGDPDIIVNNAVIEYEWVSVLEQSPEDFESQFRSCVMHNLYMVKAFVPAMIRKGRGRVIALNTECAMQCHPSQSAYAAGKRGMDGLLRVLAREIGPHQITVNQVAPGYMVSRKNPYDPVVDRDYVEKVPLRKRGDAKEVAYLVAFLASDYAGFISGAYIPVSGGNVMPTI